MDQSSSSLPLVGEDREGGRKATNTLRGNLTTPTADPLFHKWEGEDLDIASPGPVDEEETPGHQHDGHGKGRHRRLVQHNVTGRNAGEWARKAKTDNSAAE